MKIDKNQSEKFSAENEFIFISDVNFKNKFQKYDANVDQI